MPNVCVIYNMYTLYTLILMCSWAPALASNLNTYTSYLIYLRRVINRVFNMHPNLVDSLIVSVWDGCLSRRRRRPCDSFTVTWPRCPPCDSFAVTWPRCPPSWTYTWQPHSLLLVGLCFVMKLFAKRRYEINKALHTNCVWNKYWGETAAMKHRPLQT